MVNEVNVNGTIEDLSVKSLNHVGGVQVGTPGDGNILKYDAVLGTWTEGEAPSGGVGYSTEEVDTGVKWIDGKPIYRRTYVFDYADVHTTPFYLDTNVSVDWVVNAYGSQLFTGVTPNICYHFPYQYSDADSSRWEAGTFGIRLFLGTDWINTTNKGKAMYTFEYTKTTD